MRTNVRHASPPAPYGCRWCGWRSIDHGLIHVPSVKWHRWSPPTTAQTRARERAHLRIRRRSNATRYPIVRFTADDPPTPDGCRWCGYPVERHGGIGGNWSAAVGVHGYTAPTEAQRLKRMTARRERRLAARETQGGTTS